MTGGLQDGLRANLCARFKQSFAKVHVRRCGTTCDEGEQVVSPEVRSVAVILLVLDGIFVGGPFIDGSSRVWLAVCLHGELRSVAVVGVVSEQLKFTTTATNRSPPNRFMHNESEYEISATPA